MFNVFNGVIGGVATQANNIGQLAGIASVLGFVLLIIGALFVVFRRIIGGFGVAGRIR
jgi:flagellar biogenesis protein FliO